MKCHELRFFTLEFFFIIPRSCRGMRIIPVLLSCFLRPSEASSFWASNLGLTQVTALAKVPVSRPAVIQSPLKSMMDIVGGLLMYFDHEDAENQMGIINVMLEELANLSDRFSARMELRGTSFDAERFRALVVQFQEAIQSKPRWTKDSDASEAQRLAELVEAEIEKLSR